MQSSAKTVEEYLNELPVDRKDCLNKLRAVINENLPEGFEERMSYGMIGWVVPHALYPAGYHCTPELPLPFMNIASQKNFVALYNMCIYGSAELKDWFEKEYAAQCKTKLDMGKSCIRFKKLDQIPYKLIGELAAKITPQEWIRIYESSFKKA